MTSKVAPVISACDAIGSAIVRKFAQRDLVVCAARRNGERLAPLVSELNAAEEEAHAFSCDARREDAVTSLLATTEAGIGEIDVVVFNIGANVPMGILDTDSRRFFNSLEMECFAGFPTGREAAVAREVFGAPTLCMDGEMYFVQDRLDFVEESLRG